MSWLALTIWTLSMNAVSALFFIYLLDKCLSHKVEVFFNKAEDLFTFTPGVMEA